MNFGNAFMTWMLRSPLHGMLSGSTALVTVTGRKSGRAIATPVNYVRDGETLWVTSLRERTWWRNLQGGAPMHVLLAGQDRPARGEALVDEAAVTEGLARFFASAPQYLKAFGIAPGPDGRPAPEALARLARERVVVRISLA